MLKPISTIVAMFLSDSCCNDKIQANVINAIDELHFQSSSAVLTSKLQEETNCGKKYGLTIAYQKTANTQHLCSAV